MTTDRGAPLRIAVDASPVIHERSGVGHTTAHLLEGLAARGDVEVAGYAISRHGRAELAGLLPAGVRPATSWMPARVAHRLWQFGSWPTIEHWAGATDVVHATNFVVPPSRAPTIVTVHDLAFAHSPELCRPETLAYDGLLRRAIARGATVHAVSDHVAAEVRDHFGLGDDRVVRVYYGVDDTVRAGTAARGHGLAGSERYVLAVGTVEPRKNLPALVRAFSVVAAGDPGLVLVLAGADGWGGDALDDAVARSAISSRVRRLGYVSDTDRADLLAGALVLAFPSLYEGFGHPPFEAMAAGVPVVTSRAGAIPEAVGDAALLIDPHNVDALANALARAIADDELRASLVARGHDRVRAFPWPRAIDELVALYRHVAHAG